MGVRGGRGGKGRVGGGGSDPEEEGLILRKRAFSVRDRPSLAGEPLGHMGDVLSCGFKRGHSASWVLAVVGWGPQPWGGSGKKNVFLNVLLVFGFGRCSDNYDR